MGLNLVAIFHKRHQMRQFMDQGDQKRIRIQIPIDTDPVIGRTGSMTIVPEDAFPLPGDREVHAIVIQVVQAELRRSRRDPLA